MRRHLPLPLRRIAIPLKRAYLSLRLLLAMLAGLLNVYAILQLRRPA